MRRALRQDVSALTLSSQPVGRSSSEPPDLDPEALRAARRQLIVNATGLVASSFGFGLVFGLTARSSGFSPIEAIAFSLIVFAGASQFAAVGMVAAGFAWPAVVLLTALVNARHLLYSAAMAPWLRGQPLLKRIVMAHVLTDEAFALASVHFRRIGRVDPTGYWIAAIGSTFIPWNVATILGVFGGQFIPDPRVLGLDVVFPAAMAGLAVGLSSGRREVAAAAAGVACAVVIGLLWDSRLGIVVGGVVGPFVGLAVPAGRTPEPDATEPGLDGLPS
ncbi:MAG TPA: AzlC family ABC transporter permease [Candidatus Limnocylindrales bacterium]